MEKVNMADTGKVETGKPTAAAGIAVEPAGPVMAGPAVAHVAEQGIGGKADPADAIDLIARGVAVKAESDATVKEGKMDDLEKQVEDLKKSDDPNKKACGYDFDIALKQMKLEGMTSALTTWEGFLTGGQGPDGKPLTDEQKEQCRQEIEKLKKAINGWEEDVNGKKVKKKGLTEEIDELKKERNANGGDKIPNVVEEVAKLMGVEEGATNPLESIFSRISALAANQEESRKFLASLKEKEVDEGTISEINKIINSARESDGSEKNPAKKALEIAKKGSILLAFLLIVQMWMAAKSGKEREMAG